MNRIALCLLLATTLLTVSSTLNATTDEEDPRVTIAKAFPGVEPENVRPSPIRGLYEITAGPMVVYASEDGRYLVQGEIHDLETDENLTESRLKAARAQTLAGLGSDELIVFGEADAKHTVTVFTDVDCSYCRLLHSNIDEYNAAGITVRYAAYPRNGLASETWRTMERVWCAPDRRRALTLAKQDRKFEAADCEKNDRVTEQWQLGRMLGVRGTPAIFTSSGDMIPGYVPPAELVNRLESLQGTE